LNSNSLKVWIHSKYNQNTLYSTSRNGTFRPLGVNYIEIIITSCTVYGFFVSFVYGIPIHNKITEYGMQSSHAQFGFHVKG
jgi:hypothetical protein